MKTVWPMFVGAVVAFTFIVMHYLVSIDESLKILSGR